MSYFLTWINEGYHAKYKNLSEKYFMCREIHDLAIQTLILYTTILQLSFGHFLIDAYLS